jgi:hypothetical protein
MKKFKERKLVKTAQKILEYSQEIYLISGLMGLIFIFSIIKISKYL